VVNLPFAALLNPTESLVLINAQNQLGLSTTTSTGLVHSAASLGTEAGIASSSSLVATTSTPILPPQPLYRAPAMDRGPAAPRFFEEPQRFVPLDFTTPALGWDFVSREAPVRALDLIAIAEHAAALGRVADPGPAEPLAPVGAPAAVEQKVPENSPTLDPVLAGAVITIGGALALRTARNGRSRRWPTFWPGR
jgi:hypothetical protein